MAGPGAFMGWWGNLGSRCRGIITYSLSPFEQRAFAGLSKGFYNGFRRSGRFLVDAGPGLGICYLVYVWASDEHERLLREKIKESH